MAALARRRRGGVQDGSSGGGDGESSGEGRGGAADGGEHVGGAADASDSRASSASSTPSASRAIEVLLSAAGGDKDALLHALAHELCAVLQRSGSAVTVDDLMRMALQFLRFKTDAKAGARAEASAEAAAGPTKHSGAARPRRGAARRADVPPVSSLQPPQALQTRALRTAPATPRSHQGVPPSLNRTAEPSGACDGRVCERPRFANTAAEIVEWSREPHVRRWLTERRAKESGRTRQRSAADDRAWLQKLAEVQLKRLQERQQAEREARRSESPEAAAKARSAMPLHAEAAN